MTFIFKYLKNYKKLLALSLILAIINQVFSMLDPQVLQRLIDNYLTKSSTYTSAEYIKWILMWIAGFIWVAMISRIAKNFQDYFTNVMTQSIGMSTYQEVIEHTFALPYADLEDQQSGNLLNKIQKAKDSVQTYIYNLISIAFISFVAIILVIWYSFWVDWRIGLVYVSLIPIMLWTSTTISKKIKSAQETITKESAKVSWSITESIRNMSLIKMLWLVWQEMHRLSDVNDKVLWLELSKVKQVRSIEFIQWTLINAMRVFLIWFLAYLVYVNSISVGQLMTLYFYSFFIFGMLGQFGQVIKSYQEASANDELLQEIKNKIVEPDTSNGVFIDKVKNIKADNISFSYSKDSELLSNINFEINKWQSIAFVWLSWSGKSTVLKLLAGLYKTQSGNIYINSQDISNINLDSYKKQLWIVSQDAQLFSGSIADNLRFVNPTANDEDLRHVLDQAALTEFITELPDGINAYIWEGGLKLSWWQKQRLAIARALLRNPSILIFDEATSALDSLVEKEITQTIKNIWGKNSEMMVVLVAHRLSTIMHADNIYVMQKGKIIESGNHKELLDKDGLYNAMRKEQIWAEAEDHINKK